MPKIGRVLKQILIILKEDTRGLTIGELAKRTNVSRITASMALMKLEGASQIEVRVIGNCKLHYLKKDLSLGLKGDKYNTNT